eukprot:2250512-Rhodomonas_salina.1
MADLSFNELCDDNKCFCFSGCSLIRWDEPSLCRDQPNAASRLALPIPASARLSAPERTGAPRTPRRRDDPHSSPPSPALPQSLR